MNQYLEWRGKHEMRTTYKRKESIPCVLSGLVRRFYKSKESRVNSAAMAHTASFRDWLTSSVTREADQAPDMERTWGASELSSERKRC